MANIQDKKKLLEQLFLHDKPAKLLISMKESGKYASVIAKNIDCTYSHCVRILQDMETLGLVEFQKKGRIKFVKLTKLGEDVAFAIENLVRVFSKFDGP